MGKGKKNVSSSEAGVPKKQHGDWAKSAVKDCHLEGLKKDGLVPEGVRHPGSEVIPRPRPGERVSFVDFAIRGLSFPVHEFFRGLLYAYGVQIHHFTPNAILHIACFITLCECFLGVNPHWGLWKRIFFVKRQTVWKGGRSLATGGFGIQVRADVEYFNLRLVESVQGWRKRWFYVDSESTPGQSSLPEFSADALVHKKRTWRHDLTTEEEAEANRLLAQVSALQTTPGKEVTRVQLISTFLRRRVQPLQARLHAMWGYDGPNDLTRTRRVDFSDDELEYHVKMITAIPKTEPCALTLLVKPYGEGNWLPKVRPFPLLFSFILF